MKIVIIIALFLSNCIFAFLALGVVWLLHRYNLNFFMVLGGGAVLTAIELILALDDDDNW